MRLRLLHRLIVVALGYKLQSSSGSGGSSESDRIASLAHPILLSRLAKVRDVLRCHLEESVVMFSGNGRTDGSTEAVVMRDIFASAHDDNASGVTRRFCIRLEEESSNTVENALFVRNTLLSDGAHTAESVVHVVSSRFHMTRVKLIFDHVFGQDVVLQYHSADDAVDNSTVAELLRKEAISTLNLNNYLHANRERFQLTNVSNDALYRAHNTITTTRDTYLHL